MKETKKQVAELRRLAAEADSRLAASYKLPMFGSNQEANRAERAAALANWEKARLALAHAEYHAVSDYIRSRGVRLNTSNAALLRKSVRRGDVIVPALEN